MRKLEQFWFRYFSEATLNTKSGWVRYAVAAFFGWTALLGVLFDVFGRHTPAKVLFIIFFLELLLFGLLWITAWVYHNWRLRK
jgi:hypothetical protein